VLSQSDERRHWKVPVHSTAIYNAKVIAPLRRIDWRRFLDRPPLPSPSLETLESYRGMKILITGAGGSIGSSLGLRLARLPLASLILLDSNESHLMQLQEAWMELGKRTKVAAEFVLADAGDTIALEHLFEAHRPDIVFHAAAYKHVPLLEQQPFAAIASNIFVTETVAASAARHRAHLVLLSTDKAVHPVSILGATKRASEEIVLRNHGSVLRLGNVLASSGSVTEIFASQIKRGGPLTVTDPAARRYCLTMDEAVDLLLIASQAGCATVLAPDFPSDQSIAELARFMARSLAPDCETAIQFCGLRPGDKLTERLWDDWESASPANDGFLSISSDRRDPAEIEEGLAALRSALRELDLSAALALLRCLVPGFTPSQAVQALVEKHAPWVRA
jgi:FlaA1/EpsC-like NDP-sugar epimerase